MHEMVHDARFPKQIARQEKPVETCLPVGREYVHATSRAPGAFSRA